MNQSQRKSDFNTLVEFVLAQAETAPLEIRVPVYRALSNLIGHPEAGAQLARIADELEHVADQYQQFSFMLQKPVTPSPDHNGPTGK
jgi:hypothetical protein